MLLNVEVTHTNCICKLVADNFGKTNFLSFLIRVLLMHVMIKSKTGVYIKILLQSLNRREGRRSHFQSRCLVIEALRKRDSALPPVFKQMVMCFPSTPKKLAMTIGGMLSGAAIFAVGAHLSYVNVAPQQARTKARDDLVMKTLKKKYGYTSPYEKLARIELYDKVSHESVTKENYARARNDLVKETFSDLGFKK
ncbi:hypothetical protein VNO78_27670 [Psophocarpus tetragonolobus]|uniref:Uncharacterized protein n=1 Tax=Psophocarpus tetragonolobus TaxID=3891 RepID=A0AAN9S373_PSOTE